VRRIQSGYRRTADNAAAIRKPKYGHVALQSIGAELFEEIIVKADDMRKVRLTLLESELASIGRKGLKPADMIKRIARSPPRWKRSGQSRPRGAASSARALASLSGMRTRHSPTTTRPPSTHG
jgi:hypothetical protein